MPSLSTENSTEMEPETQENSPQTDSVANKTLGWTRIGAIAAVIGVIVTIAIAVVNYLHPNSIVHIHRSSEPLMTATIVTPTSDIISPPSPADPKETTPTPFTGCLQGNSPVLCGSRHDKEVFQPREGLSCDTAGLITYLGGEPGVDLLNADLEIAAASNASTLCAVTSRNGLPDASIEGAWNPGGDSENSPGDQFRRCLDSIGNPISCDKKHSSEIIYEGPDDVDCEAKYLEFTGRSLNEDYSTIKVLSSSSGEQRTCTATLRSNSDALTASLRRLHSRSLPLER